jgi:hypothetical protein
MVRWVVRLYNTVLWVKIFILRATSYAVFGGKRLAAVQLRG